jgi:cob(I)alamin adenosyltransferase
MGIYTKGGDKGKTSLYDDKRVTKDDIRVESYGTVDELITVLGVAKNYASDEEISEIVFKIQNKLFVVTTNLATEDKTKVRHNIKEEDIKDLEAIIDVYMGRLNDPTGFIVPGSNLASAYLHVGRTVCRRAERRIVSLSGIADIDPLVIKYVNRLSDVLYALARFSEEEQNSVNYN